MTETTMRTRRETMRTPAAPSIGVAHDGVTSRERGEPVYTVQEAAERTGLSEHTLRYYERAGLLAPIFREASSRHRRYGDGDLRYIEFLKRLRATGMPIQQMRRYGELVRQGEETSAARLAMLQAHREAVCAHIAELESHLGVIDYKIANYKCLTLEACDEQNACLPTTKHDDHND